MSEYIIYNGELYHYGVKGMKWGIRRGRKQLSKLSKESTVEERINASATLRKHRDKATNKLEKLNKKQPKLQKRYDKAITKMEHKSAKKYAKAAKLRKKKYGMFTSTNKAAKLEFKAIKLDVKASKIQAKAEKYKAAYMKNKKNMELFKLGIDEIDKIMADYGMPRVEEVHIK